jgi:phage protein
MTKVNQQTMKNQYDHQYNTFCRKNHDYGNSFEESLDQFGIVASIVRMSDKMNRLASLTDESKTQQVGSESLLDTLEDLSNYAAMTACWLKGVREEDGENTIYADNKPVVTYKEDTSKYEADVTIGNDLEFTDAVRDVVTMLKVVFKIHCKIEEFKMTEEDYEELEHIKNRLRSMVNDGTISEGLMRKLIDIHVKLNPDSLIYQLFKQPKDVDNHQKHPKGVDSIRDLFPKSILKPAIGLSILPGETLYKLPRGVGKSRMVLSRLTGIDCFDLEPGHIPEVSMPTNEEPKNIYEELEELFVKQNEHIKVLLISGAGKDDIKPLAILDYKSKTSEAVRGYDLMVALDCLIPNLSKAGLEHFIDVANNVLKMKDFDHE